MRRIVVTGLGAVTPIGNNVEEFWKGIKEEKVGIDVVTKYDTTDYKVHLAAEVKNFNAKDHIDFMSAKRMDLFSQYAVVAAGEALKDSGITMEQEDPFRVGVSVGCGIGSMQTLYADSVKISEGKQNRINPLCIPLTISNMAAGHIGIYYKLKGKNINVVTACATGTNSIGEAFRSIQYGEADVMVAGGTEGAICPLGMGGFAALTALSTSTDPLRASIPFDKERNGFVMGEGAGIVILEELEHAKARGAKIYAEVVGYGCTCDAYHITSPAPDGSGAAMAMTFAMKDAGIEPTDITYINAHGTSTHHNDAFETVAIKKAFGDHAKNIKINSTKSMVGHMLGAAGGIEFLTCVKEIEEGYIHPTVGYQVPDEECDLDYVTNGPIHTEVKYALSNSLGFGGHNATIIAKKYEA